MTGKPSRFERTSRQLDALIERGFRVETTTGEAILPHTTLCELEAWYQDNPQWIGERVDYERGAVVVRQVDSASAQCDENEITSS